MSKENKIISAIAVVVIVVVAILGIMSSAGGKKVGSVATSTVAKVSPENFFEGQMPLEKLSQISSCPLTADKDAFAKCLTDKGFVMYGAAWCSHCAAQKALFGDSFKYIKYVECPDNINFCLDKGVQGYPTWIREVSTSTATSTVK
jgi:hypothetical protein